MSNLKECINDISGDFSTPLFILDEMELIANRNDISNLCEKFEIKALYSVKANSLVETINVIGNAFTGFAVSSLFEARVVRERLGDDCEVHYTSPMIKWDELSELGRLCNILNINSVPQLHNLPKKTEAMLDIGARINPSMSVVDDNRYDPCRKYSKLGISIDVLKENEILANRLSGLHFHTNCESDTFRPLFDIVDYVDRNLEGVLQKIKWVNLGGGYLFPSDSDHEYLEMSATLLHNKYGVDVYIEPGKAAVKDAGYLVSTVIDLFESDGKQIAVLDTTVNHAPEVFEYQYSPDVIGHTDSGEYEYILAGCSCLAGDLFGEYRFNEPLEIGSRVIFTDMAAYSLVKANMFNGINLPSIYKYSEDGSIELIKEYTYQDYRSRLGEMTSETSRERNIDTSNQESSKVISLSRGKYC